MARGFVAPRSRPWGSPRFRFLVGLTASRDPKVFEIFLDGDHPSKLPPPLAAGPPVTAASCEARVHRMACPLAVGPPAPLRVATVQRLCPRPQGFLPPGEFVASTPRCRDAPLDAPMGFGSTRSDACHARCAPDRRCDPFHLAAPNRSQVSRLPRGTRRQRFSALSGSERGRCSRPASGPKTKGRSPAGPARSAARRLPRFRPARSDSRRSPTRIGRSGDEDPEGFHRAGPFHPKVLGLRLPRRTLRRAAPRTQRAAPEGWHRWFEAHPGLAHHLEVTHARSDGLVASLHTRRCARSSARHSHVPRGTRGEPARATPEGIASSWRPRRSEDRRGSWLRHSSKLEAGLRPDRHRLHRSGQARSEDRILPPTRRSTGGRSGPKTKAPRRGNSAQPTQRWCPAAGPKRCGRDEPKRAAGLPVPKPEDALTPCAPKRARCPAPVTRCGR